VTIRDLWALAYQMSNDEVRMPKEDRISKPEGRPPGWSQRPRFVIVISTFVIAGALRLSFAPVI
jgi:hypothetical protein